MRFLVLLVVALVGGKATAKVNSLHQSLQIRGGGGGLAEGESIDWRFFLAGGICAATSHGITTPIDVVKTRMQTNPEKYTKGVLQATKDIIATDGKASHAFLNVSSNPSVYFNRHYVSPSWFGAYSCRLRT